MSLHKVRYYRPELDVLEDRVPPSNLLGILHNAGGHDSDEEALLRVLETVTLPAQARGADNGQSGSPGNSSPGVLPPQSHPFGKTYGEWSAAEWQWLYSLPVDNHPLFDTAPISTGQSGHVWFLGGTFASTEGPGGVFVGKADRTGTIPAGTALYFPLVDAEASTLEGNGTTAAQLSAVAKSFADAIVPQSLFAQVDGTSIQNLASFRAQSPAFTYGPLPDNNVLAALGTDAPAGATSLSVADGYHVMLAPLSVGTHTLHFGGSAHIVQPGLDLTFTQDITYHLTVVPK